MYEARNQYSYQAHYHYPSSDRNKMASNPGTVVSPDSAQATEIFEKFITTTTFKSVLHHYQLMCNVLRLRPTNIRHFYPKLKSKIRSWKAQVLWSKFDKRAAHKCYNHGKICNETKVLIIGCGPCGLRAAIEAQLLGAKVVVVEKRDRFSRNNVLHLWPFVIADLKALGAKKFYGKFCAGAIDHISIRQLQCILLKVALLLGVEVFEGVAFDELLEPPEDQSQRIGFHARFSPVDHPVNQYEFDVLIGADGQRNTLMGFKRKEFRGKLAIAITANFINKHTEQEARVQEISGVAFIFNQKFFKDLYAETGIDLENIVYYKDETHYFVMTAKKHSLINKGVILRDLPDTQQLLHSNNVDRKALSNYAMEAADFSTNYLMPHLDFAVNHYGKPDIAMFDFTSMFAAENACRVIQCRGHKLLVHLVGDSLLEPFWPTGSGCARGFLSTFDACWAIRSWASHKMTPLEVIAERESIYRLLNQTTPENLGKDFSSYTLEPSTRYPTVNSKVLLPFQVHHLFTCDDVDVALDSAGVDDSMVIDGDLPRKRKRTDSIVQPDTLLSWCQKQVAQHADVNVEDFETSFHDGIVLCALIHRYRPDLIDFDSLSSDNKIDNIQLAVDILESEFGIVPIINAEDLVQCSSELTTATNLIPYVSQIHDTFRGEIPQSIGSKPSLQELKAKTSDIAGLEDFPIQVRSVGKENIYPDVTESSAQSSVSRFSCKSLDDAKVYSTSSFDTNQMHKKRCSEDFILDKKDPESNDRPYQRLESREDFCDRVKGLEVKLKNGAPARSQQKPKDMVRAIGKLEKTDWNLSAIEKKIEENPKILAGQSDRARVPKWSKDSYVDRFHNIERRLRENGEDEERIAKYLDIDASLKRLERKLREGTTLETGLRGHNKVSNLASQLYSKWNPKEHQPKITYNSNKQHRELILTSSSSDLCYFCGTRVYLVERLSAEGKFFHRQCFKCCYCGALLRLGNYIYDRENRYGGKFFCIPHFGLTVRSRTKKPEPSPEEVPVPPTRTPLSYYGRRNVDIVASTDKVDKALLVSSSVDEGVSSLVTPKNSPSLTSIIMDDRGTTPERVEFENSNIEQSDEEEYLSEDEWTDRNFGASANELDDDNDDDSDCSSDFSDEKLEEEVLESSHQLTGDETRRLAEAWKRKYRYSKCSFDESDQESMSESEEDIGEEHGIDGDKSHTATEGEVGEYDKDDDEDEDDERAKRARELRRLELNINVDAPPRKADTSDSGSDTEVASDGESNTEIDTDSEFAEDHEYSVQPKDIPSIVIDDITDEAPQNEIPIDDEFSEITKEKEQPNKLAEPIQGGGDQFVDLVGSSDDSERSSSLTDLTKNDQTNPFTEQLKRLLQKTESMEAVSMQRTQLKRNYLLGTTNYSPTKSASSSSVIIGDRFKSFMDKISETQKKLQPAPEPSLAMQAFLNSSSSSTSKINMSPSLSGISLSFPVVTNEVNATTETPSTTTEESSEISSKSEEGKLFSFTKSPQKEVKVQLSNVSFHSESLPSEENHQRREEPFGDIQNDTHQNISDDVDAKNFVLIDSIEKIKQVDNSTDVEDLANLLVLDIDLNTTSKDDSRLLDLEIMSNKNFKNITNDSIVLDGTHILDIDECFDQLANDAILEINSSKVLLPSVHMGEFPEPVSSSVVTKDNIDNNCNIESDIADELASITKMDESGFKSMDDNKTNSDNLEELPEALKFSYSHKINNAHLDILSPETEEDLSVWADEEDILTEDLDDQFVAAKSQIHEPHASLPMARMASLESLEDSDSAISVSLPKVYQHIVTNVTESISPIMKESQNMEFMDTSESSQEADSTSSYNQLEEENLTTLVSQIAEEKFTDEPKKPLKSKSSDIDELITVDNPAIKPSMSDSSCKNMLQHENNVSTPKNYDDFIPTFMDRKMPFSLARDSIDVRKSSSSKPLFTPSREDILQRQKNERERLPSSFDSTSSSPSLTPVTETKTVAVKVRDGDVVKDMVMSRLTRRSSDKIARRGSRNALYLSFNSSTSSLFGSELSFSKEGTPTSDNCVSPVDATEGALLMKSSSAVTCSSLLKTLDNATPSPRTVLPATPLTHPERFRQDSSISKKELFKSAPHIPSATDTPPELPARTPYISTAHLNASTQTPPISKSRNRAQSESPLSATRRTDQHRSEGSTKLPLSATRRTDQLQSEESTKLPITKRDPEERLKELLAERKNKDVEDQRKEVRMRNKDFCLKECLEEYRLKRCSAPVPHEFNFKIEKSDLGLTNRNIQRPSRLDIESMHVFSNESFLNDATIPPMPTTVEFRDRSASFSSAVTPKSLQVSSVRPASLFSAERAVSAVSPFKISPSVMATSPPTSSETVVTKKPVKKSKDRQRRRSLIQVFTGMFSKSDDKTKSSPEEEDLTASQSSTSVSPALVTLKSPSVKQRFSKLRLSRTKKKEADVGEKNRSSSVDDSDFVSVATNRLNCSSLPTTPSRTIFSILASPSNQLTKKNHSPSEEENPQLRESTRKRKAAMRAVKQADQKRLRMAQEIQRQLEECEVKIRELDLKGVKVEKTLIGEMRGWTRDDEPELMKDWFRLVHEKNSLERWQDELVIKAKQLELEDRHVRFENELRQSIIAGSDRSGEEIDREGTILAEIISVIDQKDALGKLLDEDRRRYIEEDKDLEEVRARKIVDRRHFQIGTGV